MRSPRRGRRSNGGRERPEAVLFARKLHANGALKAGPLLKIEASAAPALMAHENEHGAYSAHGEAQRRGPQHGEKHVPDGGRQMRERGDAQLVEERRRLGLQSRRQGRDIDTAAGERSGAVDDQGDEASSEEQKAEEANQQSEHGQF